FVVVDRAVVQELLDVAAGCGRGVHEQDAAGFAADALPGMRDVAREERAGAGPADGDLVADLEGDLADEHPGDLVAVAVQMEEALGADGHGFLEQHDVLIGLVADELQGGEALARPPVRPRAASGCSTEEWPRPCTSAPERRARSRERNTPLRSRNPGPRRRDPTCSRAPSRMSARRQRAPVRARTTLCESRARGPRIRRPYPSTRSARSALRLPCARPRDSRARAAHSSRACTPSMLSS